MTRPAAATWCFRIAAILWVVWGVVHVFAGVVTLQLLTADKTAEAVHGIASKVDLATLQIRYPPAVSALLAQHAINLLWFGLVTTVAAPFVWRGARQAVYLAALVGGLADLAFFLCIDLGGYATPPGPQMTYICLAAILTSLFAASRRNASGA